MNAPINELQQLVVRAAAEKQAFDILILDLRNRSDLTDSFIICSGKSRVQVQAIADSIQEHVAKSSHKVYAVEGYSSGQWVVVDLADVIVHVFYEETRRQYDLERLWGDVPVIDAVGL